MGSTSRSFSNTASWTFSYTFPDEIKITGSTFALSSVIPSVTAYAALPAGSWSSDIRGVADASFTILGTQVWYSYGTWLTTSWPSGTWKTLSGSTTSTKSTSTYFNSNNSTTRKVLVQATNSGSATISDAYYNITYTGNLGSGTVNLGYLVLDVPPTANVSAISYDTGYIYSNLTTASVTVSNSTAYYGGTISSVEFAIGSQTATLSGDGTLSIALNAGGTFTPTVTVTDSRGQTQIYSLDPITVNTYTPPTVSFDVERTDSTGTPDDEGTYGLIEATLTFADVIATAIAPSVVLTDENGTQTTPTVTWYTDDTLTTTVTWASVSSGDTVYGLFSGVNTQYSYSVSVRPRDSEGTGTAITQTLAAAFYTLDFLAGGHGIAFGKPASNVGFECAMDATFEADCVAQDMTQQEIDDFVDSIGGGGDPIADVVVEQGVDGIWTYRKWSSGIAECWGTWNGSISHYATALGGYAFYTQINYPTSLFISPPIHSYSAYVGSGFALTGTVTTAYADKVVPYAIANVSGTQTVYFYIHAIGKWK